MEADQEKKSAIVTSTSRIKVERQPKENLQTKELIDIQLGLMEPISKDRRSTDPDTAEERNIDTGKLKGQHHNYKK